MEKKRVLNYRSGTGSGHTLNRASVVPVQRHDVVTTGPMSMKNIFYDSEKEPESALQIMFYFDF